MSTCQGAPPPHLDCSHGKQCDWIAPFSPEMARMAEKKQAEQEALIRSKFPDNRQGRRALERALKKRSLR